MSSATGSKISAFFRSLKTLRWLVWASLATQILIVVTGGLVRLTGSGLGCPTWPKCTDDSLTSVPEQGIHGLIEFGNRLLTFVLLLVAVLTLISVLLTRKTLNRRLTLPAVVLVLGILAQAILGGITVLVQLNPWIVGAHFVVSAVLIAFASVLVWRFYDPSVAGLSSLRALTPITSFAGIVTVLVGVLVTGAGPHAGDTKALRNGLDLEVWQHFHSYPGYAMIALLVITFLVLWRVRQAHPLQFRVTALTLIVSVLQAGIGVAQSRLGVPPLLVGIHLLGAAVLCSLITFNHIANRAK